MVDEQTDSDSIGDAGKTAAKGSSPMKLVAVAMIATILIAAPLAYLAMTASNDGGDEEPTFTVIVTGKTSLAELNLSDMQSMETVTKQSMYQNRFGNWKGQGTYAGVNLSEIADAVGGMSPGDVMTVIASDNYTQNLSYSQVYPNATAQGIQGCIVLAYSFNGTKAPNWTSGPMIAVLSPDGQFSNDDFNATASDNLEFSGSTSAGSLWVKNVAKIKIEATILTIASANKTANMTMTHLKSMVDASGSGALKKSTGTISGPNNYTGIMLGDLVDLLYSDSDFSIEVEATDGYKITYSASQVDNGTFANYSSNGTVQGLEQFSLILALEKDGIALSYDDLRVVIVDPAKQPITDGHFWTKYVRYIHIKPFVRDWNLSIEGLWNMTMDRQTFESLASCEIHQTEWEFSNATGNHTYEGIPLWVLIAAVDGADTPTNHYEFNDTWAAAGYNVTIYAPDGYNKTFLSSTVARNNSIIVAYLLDGDPLPAEEFPLRLVGDYLTSGQKIKMVCRIVIS